MEIVGNKKAVKLLERIVDLGCFANAYLFVGPRDVGKTRAALFFAKKIIHSKNEIDVNLIIIKPEIEEKNGITKKKDIKIEAIRELKRQLGLTAFKQGYKAVVIMEAERLGVTSQNALLKTLEEPNEKVILILVTQDEKKLSPTIISRCQKIRMGLADEDELKGSMPNQFSDKKEALFWSAGKSELLHSFLEDSVALNVRREAKKELLAIIDGTVTDRMNLAEKWSKNVGELAKKMEIWVIFLRQVMLNNLEIENLSQARALLIIEGITAELKNIQGTNANARLILENLFIKL